MAGNRGIGSGVSRGRNSRLGGDGEKNRKSKGALKIQSLWGRVMGETEGAGG